MVTGATTIVHAGSDKSASGGSHSHRKGSESSAGLGDPSLSLKVRRRRVMLPAVIQALSWFEFGKSS
jgi:hypothetical protein